MKKFAKWLLGATSVIGGILVGQGIFTGEELSSIQNVIGMVLGGGGVSVIAIMSILEAVPKQLSVAMFNKVVEKYGEEQVMGILDNFEQVVTLVNGLDEKIDKLQNDFNEEQARRNSLLNE